MEHGREQARRRGDAPSRLTWSTVTPIVLRYFSGLVCELSSFRLRPRPPAMPSKDGKKIEPKTYFANERTYLQWFNAAAMLGSVSLGLVGLTATSRVIGLIFLPISVCLMLYALFMYHKRLRSIEERRSDGFHDPYGPTCVPSCILLLYDLLLFFLTSAHTHHTPTTPQRSHTSSVASTWLLNSPQVSRECALAGAQQLRRAGHEQNVRHRSGRAR